jgi:RNA polymerase sigma factor (sigma-70 family)
MNVHVTYKAAKAPGVEKEINHQIQKLERQLRVFRPELVSLKCSLAKHSPHKGYVISVNLRLPSGQLAAHEKATTGEAAVRAAFEDIVEQLGRHKELLRNAHRWTRRGGRAGRNDRQVPFESTLAAVKAPLVTAGDIAEYIAINLPALQNFVERALAYRESIDELQPGQVMPEEVVDDAILAALGEEEERPEKISLERWIYRLALRAIDHVAQENGDGEMGAALPLEGSTRERNVVASDEPRMQFYQPDESPTAESLIPDPDGTDPERQFADGESVAEIDRALRGSAPEDRDAFVLHVIEGFTIDELAVITDRGPEQVRASIARARAQLQRKLPENNWLRSRLLQSKIA